VVFLAITIKKVRISLDLESTTSLNCASKLSPRKISKSIAAAGIATGCHSSRDFSFTRVGRRKTFSLFYTQLIFTWLLATHCLAQLNFPSSLKNERDGTPIDINHPTKKAIVLIHGWTNSDSDQAPTNAYSSGDWARIVSGLKTKLQGTDWKLITYHWEQDASTGTSMDGFFADFSTVFSPYLNGVEAAANANAHGFNLSTLLNQKAPDLREVHFIAHSAGSWAAKNATVNILASNPYLVAQITLLDPFIPDANLGFSTGLSTAAMSSLNISPNRNRIFRLENYYANDNLIALRWDPAKATGGTISTQETFHWTLNGDINLQIDHGNINGTYTQYYDYHGGPIEFYADIISAANGNSPAAGLTLNNPPFTYTNVGFYRSLIYQESSLPQISSQPQTQSASIGGSVTLTVTASNAVAYEWYKDGSFRSNGATLLLSNISLSDAGTYVVRVSNNNGLVFSDRAVITVLTQPPPTISNISPQIFNTTAAGQTQELRITGSSFTSSSRLTFNDGFNNYPDRVPTFISSTELRYNISSPNAATWTLIVTNGSQASLPYTFYSVSASTQLTGLSIAGPATVAQNGTAQFVATALFNNGTTQVVTPNWSENSSATTISSNGLLSAGSVGADTVVTVSASYTNNGITKTASANITVVGPGGGGGSQVTNVITNGTFEAGPTPWGPTGYADVVALSYPHAGSWYAYIGNADNVAGSLGQFFPIPANATAATLTFYLNIVTSETTTTQQFDKMKIDLVTSEQSVGTIATFSNLDKGTNTNGAYTLKSYNIFSLLSPYRGQGLFLVFSGTTDNGLPTIFRIDDVLLNITTPNPVVLTGLSISGASALLEGQLEDYTTRAVFSDGTTQTVSPNSWSEDSTATTIDSSGFLLAGQVNADTPVTITASYTFNGVTKQATKQVTVIDSNPPPTLTSLAINGPGAMNENSSTQYTATAIFSDGSNQAVSASWSDNSSITTMSPSGLLSAGDVSQNTSVTISASYTYGSITRNKSLDVLVINSVIPPSLSSLSIGGPDFINESSTAQYLATAHYSDGSTRLVVPTWSEDASATTISTFGLLSAGAVTSDSTVNVFASYQEGSSSKSANKPVTLHHVIPVVAWGYDGDGQANVPSNLPGVLAIAGGYLHSLALTAQGTVIAFGLNFGGSTTVPPGLGGVISIAAGWTHSLALKADGTVVSWGGSPYADVPASLSRVIAISAGGDVSLALRADGTVVGWGDNEFGQTNVPRGLTGVIAISAAPAHCLALKSDGTIVGWGYSCCGELDIPSYLTNVVAIAAGVSHSLALRADGTVVAWGDNSSGQCSIPPGVSDIIAIAAGDGHSLALKGDGTVIAWGSNTGPTGHNDNQATVPSNLQNVVAISAGSYHSMALVGGGIQRSAKLTALTSRKLHGTAGGFDVNFPLTGAPGVECRSGGSNGDHSVILSFSHRITDASLSVINQVGTVDASFGLDDNKIILTLGRVENAQRLTIRLNYVTDAFGQSFPNTEVIMKVLLGDTTGNGVVNSSDVAQTKLKSGQAIDSATFRNDVICNGSINSSDVSAVKSKSGTALP
jgi:alpha-tubulin suppressor-like RCC1 family protein